MGIYIEDLQSKIPVDKRMLDLMERATNICLKKEKFDMPYEISIILTDDSRIREVNKEHRNIDKATDVLSFPIVDMYEGKIISSEGDLNMDGGLIILGDILISLERAQEQAKEYGHSFERELIFLLTHGVYHLLGFDHDNSERETKMLERQETVLQNLKLQRQQNL